jgi:hypothetical protein
MKTIPTTQIGRKNFARETSSTEIERPSAPHTGQGSNYSSMPQSADDLPEQNPFFNEPLTVQDSARALASEVICRLLIWIASGRTIQVRGLRASVALYCLRPDLVEDATLDELGALAGCTKQAVHKVAVSFSRTTGLT